MTVPPSPMRHRQPSDDGMTRVELTWIEKQIEHWIRFGRVAVDEIVDRRRRIVRFRPGAIFAFVRWASNDYGTVSSRIGIVRAVGTGEPFTTLPFVRPGMVRLVTGTKENGDNLSYPEAFSRLLALSPLNPDERNVLVSHQFFLPDGGDAENIERAENEVKQVGNLDAIPASLIADFDYAALGHIHKPMKVGSETLRYCGTPMPYSLSEENQQKGILMVEMGAKGDVQTTVLPLHPVHQVRKLRATREALLSGASEDFVSICVTDAEAAEMVGLRELLRERYPNLLELRREEKETVELAALQERTETLSPYELCLQFAGERLNAEEKALLTEVMNAMKEENA